MRIAVGSQDFQTVSGHAGRTTRFLVYEGEPGGVPRLVTRLEFAAALAFRVWHDEGPHPLDGTDVVIVGGCGSGFPLRMAMRGILCVITDQTDPAMAARAYLDGTLEPVVPPDGMAGGVN